MSMFGSRMLRGLSGGRRVDPRQPNELAEPLGLAIECGKHVLVRGPDIQSEIQRAKDLVQGWMHRRDKWHRRMDDQGIDLGQIVVTLDGAPLKKGVYAFRDGPFATMPGIRRIRNPDLGSDLLSGILMVEKMDKSHFTIATQSRWTLIGCAGGGSETMEEHLVDDVLYHRSGHATDAHAFKSTL